MKIMDKHYTSKVELPKLKGVGVCDMGCVRQNNEDNMVLSPLWTDNFLLAVAIDGVGGQEGGEVAAAIAAESIQKFLDTYRNGEPLELLSQAVQQANNDIFAQREREPRLAYMSCVLTAAILDIGNSQVYMAHVGDTRLYQYADGSLQKLSHDHSLVGYREEQGDLTEEEAMHHPQRNIISRDVGSEHQDTIEFVESAIFPLYGKGILMLCSDGLCDMITSHQMKRILESKGSLEDRCNKLVEEAKSAGGRDNVTVILVEYQSSQKKPKKKLYEVSESKQYGNNVVEGKKEKQAGELESSVSQTQGKLQHSSKHIFRMLLPIILTAVLSMAIGFSGGWFLAKSPLELKTNDSTKDSVESKPSSEPLQEPYESEKTDAKIYSLASDIDAGGVEAVSLSQVAQIFETTCHRSIKNELPEDTTVIAVEHNIKYDSLIHHGEQVWCKSHIIKKDETGYTFEATLYTGTVVKAQGKCRFSKRKIKQDK